MYIALTIIWAILNTFALQVIAFIDIISIWWQVCFRTEPLSSLNLVIIIILIKFVDLYGQVIGGLVIVILLPLVAPKTQSASYVCTHFETSPASTGVSSKPYAVILSFLVSQYSLYGYDAAAHLTEETRGADKNGPIAILASIGIISLFGWAYILALTFSIQVFVCFFHLLYLIFSENQVTIYSHFRTFGICMTRQMRLQELLCLLKYSMMHFMEGIRTQLEP